ncbi:MAG TPA: hypothetical protein VFB72_14660, partial [Verrucomicrobiae bacterium]|nr:hypothetical protein [Verrucomicrobiae bacterium]
VNVTATGGVINEPFVLLCATNIGTTSNHWTPLLTNTFGSSGTFNWSTNINSKAASGQFFVLSELLN